MRYLVLFFILILMTGCATGPRRPTAAGLLNLQAFGLTSAQASKIKRESGDYGSIVTRETRFQGKTVRRSKAEIQSIWGDYAFILDPVKDGDHVLFWGGSKGREYFRAKAQPYLFSSSSESHDGINFVFDYSAPDLSVSGAHEYKPSTYTGLEFYLRRDKDTGRMVAQRSYYWVHYHLKHKSLSERMSRASEDIFIQIPADKDVLLMRSLSGKTYLKFAKLPNGDLQVSIPTYRLANMNIPPLQKLSGEKGEAFHAAMRALDDKYSQEQNAIFAEKARRNSDSSGFRSALYSGLKSANQVQAAATAQSQANMQTSIKKAAQAPSQQQPASSKSPGETAITVAANANTPNTVDSGTKPWEIHVLCAYLDTKAGPGGTEASVLPTSTLYFSKATKLVVRTPTFKQVQQLKDNFAVDMRKFVPNASSGRVSCEATPVDTLQKWRANMTSVRAHSHSVKDVAITPRL